MFDQPFLLYHIPRLQQQHPCNTWGLNSYTSLGLYHIQTCIIFKHDYVNIHENQNEAREDFLFFRMSSHR